MKRSIPVIFTLALVFIFVLPMGKGHITYPENNESDNSFYAVAPTFFQDQNGTYWMGFIHIQNQERNIGICHSTDMVNWSDPIVVEANVYLHSNNIVFFQSQDGKYNLIYRECFITNPNASVDHMLIRSEDCNVWSDPVIITICGYEVSALQIRDGTYCLAVDFVSSLIFRWTSEPTTWYTIRDIIEKEYSLEGYIHSPFIYQDNEDRICVTYTKGYSDTHGPMQVYFTYSEDNGTSWTEPKRISNGSGEAHSSITQDKDGKYWAVWESNENQTEENMKKVIRYSTSWDLKNWSEPWHMIGKDLEHSLRNPEVRCMPNGRTYLAANYIDLPSHGGYHPSQLFLMEVQWDIDDDGHDLVNDMFPSDPSASKDTDGDGYPDEWNEGKDENDSKTGLKLDEFPENPKEWEDKDKDGYGDNEEDHFPENANEWKDTDNDGYGDNSDDFPDDPSDWIDSDGDGIGNNKDILPNDANNDPNNNGRMDGYEMDSDGDGVVDLFDKFPADPAASIDGDEDGHPDYWNQGMSEKNSTTDLKIDHFPSDPDRWDDEEENQPISSRFLIWVLIVLLYFVIIAGLFGLYAYKNIKMK